MKYSNIFWSQNNQKFKHLSGINSSVWYTRQHSHHGRIFTTLFWTLNRSIFQQHIKNIWKKYIKSNGPEVTFSWSFLYKNTHYSADSFFVGDLLTPWLLTFKSNDEPTVLSFGVFFPFSSEVGIILNMKYCCNVLCLLSSGFLCKTASKQKKVHQKISTRTNFMQIFPEVVPWHIRICQHSTQGGGNIMTYAYMSTEHSRDPGIN